MTCKDDNTTTVGALLPHQVADSLQAIACAALSKCRRREWKRDWVHGGVYLHLEVSEFIEALRGKRTKTLENFDATAANDAESEAADVLFVLLSTIAQSGLSIQRIVARLLVLVNER